MLPSFRTTVAGGVVFLGFVLLAHWAVLQQGRLPRQFRISLLLLYTLGISSAVGLTRRTLFPFHHWPLLSDVLPDTVLFQRLVAVDSAGAQQDVDFRAWEPMLGEDVTSWAFSPKGFFALDSASQVRVTRFWVRHLEASRREAIAGRAPGAFGRFLGPLAAPTWMPYRHIWAAPAQVPPAPFVGLRWILDPLLPRTRTIAHQVVRYQVVARP